MRSRFTKSNGIASIGYTSAGRERWNAGSHESKLAMERQCGS